MVCIERLFLSGADGRNMELFVVFLMMMVSATLSDEVTTHGSGGDESLFLNDIPKSGKETIPSSNKESSSISSVWQFKNYMTTTSSRHETITRTYQPCYYTSCSFLHNNEKDIIISGTYSQEAVQTFEQYSMLIPSIINTLLNNKTDSFSTIRNSVLATEMENYLTSAKDIKSSSASAKEIDSSSSSTKVIDSSSTSTKVIDSSSTSAKEIDNSSSSTKVIDSSSSSTKVIDSSSTSAKEIDNSSSSTKVIDSSSTSIPGSSRYEESYTFDDSDPNTDNDLIKPILPITLPLLISSLESTSSSAVKLSNVRESYTSNTIYSQESLETVSKIYNSRITVAKSSLTNNEIIVSSAEAFPSLTTQDLTDSKSSAETFPSLTTHDLTDSKSSAEALTSLTTHDLTHSKSSAKAFPSLTIQNLTHSKSSAEALTTLISHDITPSKSSNEAFNLERDSISNPPAPSILLTSDKEAVLTVYSYSTITDNHYKNSRTGLHILPQETQANIVSPTLVTQTSTTTTSALTASASISNIAYLQSSLSPSFTTAAGIKIPHSNMENHLSSPEYLNGDNSENGQTFLPGYSTLTHDVIETMTLETSKVSSDRGVTSKVSSEGGATSKVYSGRGMTSEVSSDWDLTSKVHPQWDIASERSTRWDVISKRSSEWSVTTERSSEWGGTSERSSKWDITSERPSKWDITSERPSKWDITSERPSKWDTTSERPSKWDITSERPSKWDITSERPSEWHVTPTIASEGNLTSAISKWGLTSSTSENANGQHINATAADVSSHGYEFAIASSVLTDSSSNTTFCCLPVIKPQAHIDEKGWAVPVTVSLSALLLVVCVILIVVCLRFKQSSAIFRPRQDVEGHSRSRSQERHQELSTPPFSTSEASPRYEQHTHKQANDQLRFHPKEKSRQPNSADVFRVASDSRQTTAAISKDNHGFELDELSPKDRHYKDSHERYRKQNMNQEIRNENYAPGYDSYSSISGNPEPSTTTFVTSHNSSWLDSRHPELSQGGNHRSTDPNEQKQHLVSANQMRKGVSKDEVQFTNVARRSDQHRDETWNVNPESSNEEQFTNTDSRYSRQHYSRDEQNSEENEHDDNREGRRDDRIASLQQSTSNGEDGHMITDDIDYVDEAYNGMRAGRTTVGGRRPGMTKCASFDDTHIRGQLGALNKNKSPTRKISTTSDTAMTFLTLPEHGHVTMASHYGTVNNLAEADDRSTESRFFIGSSTDNIPALDRSKKVLREQLRASTKHDNDEFSEQNKNIISENEINETITTKRNSTDEHAETAFSKETDNYIFPIVRKANMKIMAERQQRKLMKKQSSESQEEDSSLTDAQISPKHVDSKPHVSGEKSDLSKEKSSIPSKVASTAKPTPSRRVSYPIQIPKIILTKDNEMIVETDSTNETPSQSTTERQPRVPRIARANNPFLIEVQPLGITTEEKVRRSSAPSMPRTTELTDVRATNDRMIRSASGDHLCLNSRQEQLHHLQNPRPWSSEFFDLIQNSRRETRSDDERLKKMIDDRYDALFNHKYSPAVATNRYQTHGYLHDLPTRNIRHISNNSPYSVPHGTKLLNSETRSRIEPILEARISEVTLNRYGKPSDNSEHSQNKRINKPDWCLRSDVELSSDFPDNNKADLHELGRNSSPRPSLAHGTDGQDSDTEIMKEEPWKSSITRPEKEESRTPRSAKKNLLATKWKSFEDYSGETSSIGLFSERTLTKDGAPGVPLSNIWEQPSKRTERDDSTFYGQESSNPVKSVPQLFKDSGTEMQDAGVTSKNYEAATSSFSIPETNRDESSSHLQTIPDLVESGLSHGGFDDNFDITTTFKNGDSEQLVNNKPKQEMSPNNSPSSDTNLQFKTTVTPPDKPARVHAGRVRKGEKFKRPPSPYFFEANKVTPLERRDGENSPSRTNAHSSSQKTRRVTNPKITPVTSSADSKQQGFSKLRSRSLDVTSNPEVLRFRAVTLETDTPRPHYSSFADWSKFFNEANPTFVTSANNTLLEHSITEGVDDADDSGSEPELDLYFGAKVSPVEPERISRHQIRSKLLFFNDDDDDDDDDIGLQVSII